MNYVKRDLNQLATDIGETLNLNSKHVFNVLDLTQQGNTIPFIARYRKELTGAMEDEAIREVLKQQQTLQALDDKRQTIFNTLSELNIDDQALFEKILTATTMSRLEDLYRPYKPKRKTKATIAIENGLQPLADAILAHQSQTQCEQLAQNILQNQEKLETLDDCFQGANDILAQMANDDADVRSYLMKSLLKTGELISENKIDDDSVYRNYYQFKQPLKKLAGHQVLAINRGEKQGFLKVSLNYDVTAIEKILERFYHINHDNSFADELLKAASQDSFTRLLFPSLFNEIRNDLTQDASDKAMLIFSKNLRQALLVPPIKNQTILALDPGFKNGCKWALVNPLGHVLDSGVIYPVVPFTKIKESNNILLGLINQHPITLIVIGNGTASRETESYVSNFLKENKLNIHTLIVDESGASVYSATPLAAKELSNIPLNQRSAVSLARRVLDPLAELVKIDPKSIGVGQYQHDMNQKQLHENLYGVVESCVNQIGVNLNTASSSLLSYVSGLSTAISDNIISYRLENGAFKSRSQLLKVAKLGPKAYQQCAGFLRILNGDNPLDNTAIHPESYEVAQLFMNHFNLKLNQPANLTDHELKQFSQTHQIGYETLADIYMAIQQPTRDIRDDFPSPILVKEIMSIEDLKPNQILTGVVRNVTAFGAFVDIGVHQDGLVHLSQMANRFVKDASEIVSIGDQVKVRVLEVDVAKHRISLSMKEQ